MWLIDGSSNDCVWCCVGWEGDNACGEEFWEGRVGFVGVGRPHWWSARVPMGEQHPPMGRRPPSPTQSHQRRETKDLRRLLINFVFCFMICTCLKLGIYESLWAPSRFDVLMLVLLRRSARSNLHFSPEKNELQSGLGVAKKVLHPQCCVYLRHTMWFHAKKNQNCWFYYVHLAPELNNDKKLPKKRITQSQFTQFLAAIAALYLPSWVSDWVTDWLTDSLTDWVIDDYKFEQSTNEPPYCRVALFESWSPRSS